MQRGVRMKLEKKWPEAIDEEEKESYWIDETKNRTGGHFEHTRTKASDCKPRLTVVRIDTILSPP